MGKLLASLDPRRLRSRVISLPAVLVLVVIALTVGVLWGQASERLNSRWGQVTNTNQPVPPYLRRDVDFSLFWKVWNYIHANALEQPIKDTKLFYGALEGMVAGLGDPYSVFMNPDTARDFSQELEGSFEGIGTEIGIRDNHLVIIAPLPNTPAEKAGLKPGDRILAINDFDTAGMAVDYAVSLIRGKRGTKVSLTVLSNGDVTPKTVEIVRSRIEIEIVHSELKPLPSGGQVAYIRLAHFSSETDKLFRSAWQKLAANGPKGIVLDLRNNPGGFLDQAIDISSHWIGSGVIVKEQLLPPEFREHRSTGSGELSSVPTVVLVNQGSASASEIVAGALQDDKKATIVGERTFGKGSVQDLEEFPDGSAIKLTIAKWFTPKGRSIDKDGIAPDLVVKRTSQDVEAGRDPQLERALELLSR